MTVRYLLSQCCSLMTHLFSSLQDFAVNLENKVSSINEALQMKSLTFVIDACKVLAQARKVSSSSSSSSSSCWTEVLACPALCLQVLAYSCVYSYYNQETEKMDVMEQQTEALDLHTNALQILLGETHFIKNCLCSWNWSYRWYWC